MPENAQERLAEFKPTDPTFKLVSTVLKIVPGSPELVPYPDMPTVVGAMGGSAGDVAAATALLSDEGIDDVLWMSRIVDTGDRGYAVFTGVASALKLFFGKKEGNKSDLLETDTQQRNDAVLNALALSYMAWKAFPGTIPERVKAFTATPGGQAMLTYYAAIELGLPFADNAMLAGGRLFDDLVTEHGPKQLSKLKGLAGGRDFGKVGDALDAMGGSIRSAVDNVRPYVDKIASAVSQHGPGTLNVADKTAGILANVADVMPVYRMLGTRLAAEAAVVRARQG